MTRQVCIEIHDVAPATWPSCERLLTEVDALGRPPVSLLAVPNYHDKGSFGDRPELVRTLRQRQARGDEIVLHGYRHYDDSAPPRTPSGWVRRRLLTAGEGEFAALSRDEAARRLCLGWSELNLCFAPVRGFVAPAWLNASAVWDALRDSPLDYAATRNELIVLAGMRRVAAPAITASARAAWRRSLSRIWMRALSRLAARAPLLRVAMHPADAAHADMIDDWRALLRLLLADREPVTKAMALGLA